jgi:hypothetical protein
VWAAGGFTSYDAGDEFIAVIVGRREERHITAAIMGEIKMSTRLVRFWFWCLVFALLASRTAFSATDFWQATSGPNGGRVFAITTDASGSLFAGTESGAYRSTDKGDHWTPINTGLPGAPLVRSLAVNTTGGVFAGTYEAWNSISEAIFGKLYRWNHTAQAWEATNTSGFSGGGVKSIAINSSGHIFVSTYAHGGVYRSEDGGVTWTPIFGMDYLRWVAVSSSDVVFVGTADYGVYRSNDNGNSWTRVSVDWTNYDANAVGFGTLSGTIYVGTSGGGVFKSANNGDSWTTVNSNLTNLYISAIAVNSNGDVFAATAGGGVFSLPSGGNGWLEVNSGLVDKNVLSLAIDPNGINFAGTASGVVFRGGQSGSQVSPVIAELLPNQGPAGSSVKIAGSGFGTGQGISYVDFGVVDIPSTSNYVTSWSDTSIQLAVPHLTPATYNIAVTTPAGTSNTVSFTITGAATETATGGQSSNPNVSFGQEPVNLATGAYVYQATELVLPGRGLPLVSSRTYTTKGGAQSAFGPDWAWSFGMRLLLQGSLVTVVNEDGRQDTYIDTGGGMFTLLLGIFATLVKNADGTYTLTRRIGCSTPSTPLGSSAASLIAMETRSPWATAAGHRLQPSPIPSAGSLPSPTMEAGISSHSVTPRGDTGSTPTMLPAGWLQARILGEGSLSIPTMRVGA